MLILLDVILVIVGFILLAKGADFLVDGSTNIARKFKIPEIIIGLTIVAIGTSLPELVISVNAAIKGENSISLGNVIGSNFVNLFLVIGICIAMKPFHIKKQTRYVDYPLVVALTILLFYMINNDGIVSRKEGFILLLITILYLVYNMLMTKYGRILNDYESENEEEDKKEKKLLQRMKIVKAIKKRKNKFEKKHFTIYSTILIVVGIILLKIGGDLAVDNAQKIALSLGFSVKLVAITVVAIGTSLPELITCLAATKKGETDLAVGNIAGSQIFNIILVLGASSAITPINSISGFNDELILLILGNLINMIVPIVNERHRVGRMLGINFVLFYIAYFMINVLDELQIGV